MQISSTIRGDSTPTRKREKPRTDSLEPFEPGVAPYFGPEDGLSTAPKHESILRPTAKALASLFYRVEVEGEENLPTSGSNVYAANHSSYLDAAIAVGLPKQETRTMATIDIFKSKIGASVAGAAGVFPVNRADAHEVSRQHPKDVLDEGKGFMIFPEGTFPEEAAHGGIGPFKKGVAAIAIEGDADGIVPIVLDYAQDTKPRTGEKVKGMLLAAGVAAGTLLAGLGGGPITRALGGIISGAITGATLMGTRNASKVENKYFWNPAPKLGAAVKGAATGALIGGLAGGFGVSSSTFGGTASVALGVASGLATAKVANWWSNRPVCNIRIGEKFSVDSYQEKAKEGPEANRAAITQLTEDLHRHIGGIKSEMSGVPYDDEAPKINPDFPLCSMAEGLSLE